LHHGRIGADGITPVRPAEPAILRESFPARAWHRSRFEIRIFTQRLNILDSVVPNRKLGVDGVVDQ
jgi:hypothetical protein